MGLDITAYRFGVQVGACPTYGDFEERFDYNNAVYIGNIAELDFPDHAEGLKSFAVYEIQDASAFRAGSYSHYNWWREQVCQAVFGVMPRDVWQHPEQYDSPLVWLIHFTDCDGIIGPVKSKLIADELTAQRAKVEDWVKGNVIDDEQPYDNEHVRQGIMSKYDRFVAAFELAAQGGMVEFH